MAQGEEFPTQIILTRVVNAYLKLSLLNYMILAE